jgi:TonB family protein
MRSPYKLIPILTSAFLLSCATTTQTTQQPIPVRVNPASISPTPKIVAGCALPASTDPRGYRSPEFPMNQARKGNSGFAVMDFQINADGKAENIEVVANAPEGAFSNHSVSALKKLNFSVDQKWTQTCAAQKFRFAYQYSHSAECNPKAFPSDMTAICVTVYITPLR